MDSEAGDGYSRTKYLFRIFNERIIVWLAPKNQWIQVVPPAFQVFKAWTEGIPENTISQQITGSYQLEKKEAVAFVSDIVQYIKSLPDYTERASESALDAIGLKDCPDKIFSEHLYRLKDEVFRISYGSLRLEYSIHPSLEHLELTGSGDADHYLELLPCKKSYVLRAGSLTWSEEDANRLKRRLYIELSGFMYRRTDKDWLTIMHASSVSRDLKSVAFISASGSGKSTLSAQMLHRGYTLDADDYVAVDALTLKALPFPAALSVKSGARALLVPLFPELETARQYHFKTTRKTITYLPVTIGDNFYVPRTMKAIVFTHYEAGGGCRFEKLSVPEALQRFMEDAWVTDRPEFAGKFIDWFAGLDFYDLEYSDNEKAVLEITRLLS
jgi:hypothetical protein